VFAALATASGQSTTKATASGQMQAMSAAMLPLQGNARASECGFRPVSVASGQMRAASGQ